MRSASCGTDTLVSGTYEQVGTTKAESASGSWSSSDESSDWVEGMSCSPAPGGPTASPPSFTVNDEKEFYHCFATSEHGNIFDFVMKTQNLKFGEAVKSLANLAGMRPYTFSKQDEEREKNWQEYCSIYNQYVQFYHDEILKNESLTIARDYLKKRNLSKNEVKNFKIGFVERNSNFYEKLKDEFSEKVLVESGLFYLDEKRIRTLKDLEIE